MSILPISKNLLFIYLFSPFFNKTYPSRKAHYNVFLLKKENVKGTGTLQHQTTVQWKVHEVQTTGQWKHYRKRWMFISHLIVQGCNHLIIDSTFWSTTKPVQFTNILSLSLSLLYICIWIVNFICESLYSQTECVEWNQWPLWLGSLWWRFP